MVAADTNFEEKRKYKRLDKTVITWFKPSDPAENATTGFNETLGRVTKNIAAGGILFETDERVPLSTELNLEIKLPNVPKVIRARGKVVRVEELESHRFDLGIIFQEIDPEDQAQINEFIDVQDG